MTEYDTLKNCLFCGAKAWDRIENSRLIITCHSCNAQILRYLVPPSDWYKTANDIKPRKEGP